MGAGTCQVCGQPASHVCGKCHVASYCGRDHQRQDWKNHKEQCSPYRVCRSEELGRYLEASRDIQPGEVILKDSPLVLGPRQVTVPVCLGCYAPVDGSYSCSLCGWPMCGPACQAAPHHQPECRLSRNRSSKVQVTKFMEVNQMYECVAPLRCLWLRGRQPEKWAALSQMEAHVDQRRGTDVFEVTQVNVVEFVKKYLKMTEFEDEELHRVCGVLDVNGFEIPGPGAVGLYGRACLLEHQCVPNTCRTFDAQYNVVVRAAILIPKGGHITTSYTDPMWGTANRQLLLKTSKYFKCQCPRCLDPTELGTHLSSLRCSRCSSGMVVPTPSVLSPEMWACDSCAATVPLDKVEAFLRQTGEKLVTLKDSSLAASEAFLNATAGRLSDNHYYRSDVKLALAQMYGRMEGHDADDLRHLSKDMLERKEALCRQVLALADIFSPGETRLRGLLLYELQAALTERYSRLPKKLKSSAQAKTMLQESVAAAREASRVLQWECHLLDEHNLGLRAEAALPALTAALAKLP